VLVVGRHRSQFSWRQIVAQVTISKATIVNGQDGRFVSDEPVYQLSFAQRIMVLITVMLGNTIYAASVLISSALLPQLQGAMSATQDEVSWVMTFNIVATAVATPATGWLAARFSQRTIVIWSAAIFAVSTGSCWRRRARRCPEASGLRSSSGPRLSSAAPGARPQEVDI
jgi:Na+/melibiose symporter-like transporter